MPQSSIAPSSAPPPRSGGGIYIIAVIALLAAIGALVVWKLTVNVRVDPQGNVCSASVVEDAIHSVEVSNCVMGMFRSAKFPPPTGGCVDAKVPLSFVPRESK